MIVVLYEAFIFPKDLEIRKMLFPYFVIAQTMTGLSTYFSKFLAGKDNTVLIFLLALHENGCFIQYNMFAVSVWDFFK